MNYDDILDAVEELRTEGYSPEELYINPEQKDTLLQDANMATANTVSNNNQNKVGQIAGMDISVEDTSVARLHGRSGSTWKGVPVLEGGIYAEIGGHEVVHTKTEVKCARCDHTFKTIGAPELDKYAVGYFISTSCEDRKI